MPIDASLPGLARLITTCRQHSLTMELTPPLASAPKPGEMLLGQPADPLLIALYQRAGTATLGDFSLLRPDMAWDGLVPWNEELRRGDTGPFPSILVFGQEPGFSYYFGTVPVLANAEGLQPIVHTSSYPGEYSAVPIASNLDRFFETYSRYLELMVVDAGYVGTGVSEISFPWSVPRLIAGDTALMKLVREGRFSHLIYRDDEAQNWVTELLSISV